MALRVLARTAWSTVEEDKLLVPLVRPGAAGQASHSVQALIAAGVPAVPDALVAQDHIDIRAHEIPWTCLWQPQIQVGPPRPATHSISGASITSF